jgi:hypothetical protein
MRSLLGRRRRSACECWRAGACYGMLCVWGGGGGAMQALMGTVVAGVCWPDAQSAGKATKICM